MQKFPTLQTFPWALSVEAIKHSEQFDSYADFYQNLQANLPINSPQTRVKYSNVIQRRFFPSRSLNNLLSATWRSYRDEVMLLEIMRVLALEAEPLIGNFVIEHILTRATGEQLETQVIKDYIILNYGVLQEDSYRRLTLALKDMGYLSRHKKDLFIQPMQLSANSFLILLHDRLAPTPRIVRLSEILNATWWRYLGLRNDSEARDILRQAESAGLISRFTKVDELEQVTTCYSRDEFLQQALRL
jgi:hypothetical protein